MSHCRGRQGRGRGAPENPEDAICYRRPAHGKAQRSSRGISRRWLGIMPSRRGLNRAGTHRRSHGNINVTAFICIFSADGGKFPVSIACCLSLIARDRRRPRRAGGSGPTRPMSPGIPAAGIPTLATRGRSRQNPAARRSGRADRRHGCRAGPARNRPANRLRRPASAAGMVILLRAPGSRSAPPMVRRQGQPAFAKRPVPGGIGQPGTAGINGGRR